MVSDDHVHIKGKLGNMLLMVFEGNVLIFQMSLMLPSLDVK